MASSARELRTRRRGQNGRTMRHWKDDVDEMYSILQPEATEKHTGKKVARKKPKTDLIANPKGNPGAVSGVIAPRSRTVFMHPPSYRRHSHEISRNRPSREDASPSVVRKLVDEASDYRHKPKLHTTIPSGFRYGDPPRRSFESGASASSSHQRDRTRRSYKSGVSPSSSSQRDPTRRSYEFGASASFSRQRSAVVDAARGDIEQQRSQLQLEIRSVLRAVKKQQEEKTPSQPRPRAPSGSRYRSSSRASYASRIWPPSSSCPKLVVADAAGGDKNQQRVQIREHQQTRSQILPEMPPGLEYLDPVREKQASGASESSSLVPKGRLVLRAVQLLQKVPSQPQSQTPSGFLCRDPAPGVSVYGPSERRRDRQYFRQYNADQRRLCIEFGVDEKYIKMLDDDEEEMNREEAEERGTGAEGND